MPTYKAKWKTYTTTSGDLWDLISYFTYGDEHACAALQDANYAYRFVDRFMAGIILDCPAEVIIELDMRGPKLPDIKKLQPWR
jgi:hypothetical protein